MLNFVVKMIKIHTKSDTKPLAFCRWWIFIKQIWKFKDFILKRQNAFETKNALNLRVKFISAGATKAFCLKRKTLFSILAKVSVRLNLLKILLKFHAFKASTLALNLAFYASSFFFKNTIFSLQMRQRTSFSTTWIWRCTSRETSWIFSGQAQV